MEREIEQQTVSRFTAAGARNTAKVQAIAAHFMTLDERDAAAKCCRPSRADEPGSPRPDDDGVVRPLAFGFGLHDKLLLNQIFLSARI